MVLTFNPDTEKYSTWAKVVDKQDEEQVDSKTLVMYTPNCDKILIAFYKDSLRLVYLNPADGAVLGSANLHEQADEFRMTTKSSVITNNDGSTIYFIGFNRSTSVADLVRLTYD